MPFWDLEKMGARPRCALSVIPMGTAELGLLVPFFVSFPLIINKNIIVLPFG